MRRFGLFFLLLAVAWAAGADAASYLDENGGEVYGELYKQLGIRLPENVAHDPQLWMALGVLKREPCDQNGLNDLVLLLGRVGYRREGALSQYNFVKRCGAPQFALFKSVNTFLELSDFPMALEVADEYVRRAPTISNARYLRGVALEGNGDYQRALVDYADAIELYGADKRTISERVFAHMANAYAQLGRYCEAVTPILTWIALDPVARDNSRSQKIVSDYEQRGKCVGSNEFHKERFAVPGPNRVVTARAKVNGVEGVFIIDTGASYVSLKSAFADRAKIDYAKGGVIKLSTANGMANGKLAKADTVALGQLSARSVPVVVQDTDERSYGRGVDGLLGMSFLSRFEIQVARGFMEVRTRRTK